MLLSVFKASMKKKNRSLGDRILRQELAGMRHSPSAGDSTDLNKSSCRPLRCQDDRRVTAAPHSNLSLVSRSPYSAYPSLFMSCFVAEICKTWFGFETINESIRSY